jgi:hypothetical protein
MVMRMMVTVLVGLTVEVNDTADNEKQSPAHVECPEVLDIFTGDEQENIGPQAHHHAYHGNVLVGIHFFKIINLGKLSHVGMVNKARAAMLLRLFRRQG